MQLRNSVFHGITQKPENRYLVSDPYQPLTGFILPRQERVALNQLKTSHERCGHLMHRWILRDGFECDCGIESQTMELITFFKKTILWRNDGQYIFDYKSSRVDCLLRYYCL